ncbi:hypothetical protein NDU88_007598 [Pleurodeles waltl]|uniref:Uncharacterized protein n=1 Tax=Pleurodeles waltl TaxID=8319 RepID=A0AAV7RTP4_PLEWA|nr:hypothetical protein NDU88_007598 [Pleurodeles waltl]
MFAPSPRPQSCYLRSALVPVRHGSSARSPGGALAFPEPGHWLPPLAPSAGLVAGPMLMMGEESRPRSGYSFSCSQSPAPRGPGGGPVASLSRRTLRRLTDTLTCRDPGFAHAD